MTAVLRCVSANDRKWYVSIYCATVHFSRPLLDLLLPKDDVLVVFPIKKSSPLLSLPLNQHAATHKLNLAFACDWYLAPFRFVDVETLQDLSSLSSYCRVRVEQARAKNMSYWSNTHLSTKISHHDGLQTIAFLI